MASRKARRGWSGPEIGLVVVLVVIVILGSIVLFKRLSGGSNAVAKGPAASDSAEDNDTDSDGESTNADGSETEDDEPGDSASEESEEDRVRRSAFAFPDLNKQPAQNDPSKEPADGKPDPENKTDPETKPATTAKPETEKPAATEKPQTTPPATEPKTDPKPKTKPKPKSKGKTKTEPDPKATAEKTEPEEPKGPFDDVADLLALPSAASVGGDGPAAGEKVSLAKLHLDEGLIVNLELLGGDVVLGKTGKITMPSGQGNKGTWPITFADASGNETEVAQFNYEGGELKFAWNEVPQRQAADPMRNCQLKLTMGLKKKVVKLRGVDEVEPLIVKLDTKGTSLELPSDGLPNDISSLQLEITALSADFPQYLFDPASQIGTNKTTEILFSGDKGNRALKFRVKFSKRSGGLRLDVTPMVRPDPMGKWAPYKDIDIEKAVNQMQTQKNSAEAQMEQIRKKLAKAKQELLKYETEYQRFTIGLDGKIEAAKSFGELVSKIDGKGQVEFRVFATMGDDLEVDFIRSKKVAEAAEQTKGVSDKSKKKR